MAGAREVLAAISWVSAVAAIGVPIPAPAQTSPFAGLWSGSLSFHGTTLCTCSGSSSCPAPFTVTCDSPYSWRATVTGQGGIDLETGPGTTTCTDPSGHSSTAPTVMFSMDGQIPPSGAFAVGAVNNNISGATLSCPPYVMQFSLAPSSVNGVSPCTYTTTTTDSVSGGTLTCTANFTNTFTGKQISAPIFPMTVTTNITPTTANASAQVSPPSTLVGQQASGYVFAHARESLLASKRTPLRPLDDATADPCVLAQLNANGQLVPASASALQPFTSGVLGSQAQSVTILNNVPTPQVAGASFYVGYGTTSTSMLSSGVYQGAVTVPGASSCSAALLAGAAPNAPSALSGLWWNPNESGWGVSVTQRRNIVFAAWYTYDASGHPKWYVASGCAMPSGTTGTSGTCSGPLFEVSGPAFLGVTFDPSHVQVATVGTLQMSFQDANTASMTYTVNGQSRTVPITRQVFQGGSTQPAVDYTDLWWNENESGWGIVATQQHGTMFLAWFVYDDKGKPLWYVASNCTVVGSGCSGTLYQTSGPPFGPSFDPSAVHASAVGTISMTFADANNATLSYTVNGVSSTKTITRQLF